ncbi:MAG TPA: lytic transglycosylase domain-containing protein [Aestuariivirgaceae bacterium]|nr:lytic transglycosylase domain-containing protein [Aestuariivirgaceae bacterium]
MTAGMLIALAAGLASSARSAEFTAEIHTRQSLCGLIEAAAEVHGLPTSFFTRLIWKESGFRISAVSPKGAQGIAQFMPATAAERGLKDPFDPKQAIPASANLLRQLADEFGNVGLAAAAYNSGRRRVSEWLAEQGALPSETRHYVAAITGRDAAEWRTSKAAIDEQSDVGCLDTVAQLGRPQPQVRARAFSLSGTGVGEHVRRVSDSGLSEHGNGHVRRVGSRDLSQAGNGHVRRITPTVLKLR